MSTSTFETWVRDTRALNVAEGAFIVSCRTAYARDWLQHRLLGTVKRTLNSITGQAVEVRFEVVLPRPAH